MASARYHRVPEEDRPSSDDDDIYSRSLINADPEAGRELKLGFSNFHVTPVLRFIAFAFFLTSAIVLGLRQGYHGPYWNAPSDQAIASLVFLSMALLRLVLATLSYFVTSVIQVSISIKWHGQSKRSQGKRSQIKPKGRPSAWWKAVSFGMFLDATISVALFIALTIGAVESAGWYTRLQEGFIVGLVGL
jgi:hypothetical protein